MGKFVCLIGSLLASSVSGGKVDPLIIKVDAVIDGDIKAAFQIIDENNPEGVSDGKINQTEAEKYANMLGQKKGADFVKEADTITRDRVIDLQEFRKYVQSKAIPINHRIAFQIIDETNEQGISDGKIHEEEAARYAETLKQLNAAALFKAADTIQSDKAIDSEEFMEYVNSKAFVFNRIDNRFNRKDEDGDGTLSECEVSKALKKSADITADGSVDKKEFTVFRKMLYYFKSVDKDEDGKISECEASSDVNPTFLSDMDVKTFTELLSRADGFRTFQQNATQNEALNKDSAIDRRELAVYLLKLGPWERI